MNYKQCLCILAVGIASTIVFANQPSFSASAKKKAQGSKTVNIAAKAARLIAEAKELISEATNDPDAVKFRNLHNQKDGYIICGEYNAKNAYGGYIGYTQFVYPVRDSKVLDSHGAEFSTGGGYKSSPFGPKDDPSFKVLELKQFEQYLRLCYDLPFLHAPTEGEESKDQNP